MVVQGIHETLPDVHRRRVHCDDCQREAKPDEVRPVGFNVAVKGEKEL